MRLAISSSFFNCKFFSYNSLWTLFSLRSDRTRATSSFSLSGLMRKSSAPMRRPLIFELRSSEPVMRMTGTKLFPIRSLNFERKPKPSSFGMMISTRIRSYFFFCKALRPSMPSTASSTFMFNSERVFLIIALLSLLSSIIRIFQSKFR